MYSSPLTAHSAQVKPCSGFTLLELLAVIVIISVLASMVVPMLGNNSNRDAANAANRMVLLINQAREEAVMSATIWQVILDPVEHNYRFLQIAGNEFVEVTMQPFAGNHQIPAVTLDKLEINGQFLSVPGEIYLFPTGEQDSFRLVLQGEQREFVVAMGPVGAAGVLEL